MGIQPGLEAGQPRTDVAAAFRAALAEAPRPRKRRGWLVAVPVVLLLVVAGVVWATTRSDAPSPASTGAEERATTELADSLTSAMNDVQATCVAQHVVDDLGFATLVDDGFFAADGHFLNPDLTDQPEIKESLTRAAQSCTG